MTFFMGASNIKITGGSFNVVNGNSVVYDHSRHHTNLNSGNTSFRTIQDSHNDHSSNYNGVAPRDGSPAQRSTVRDQGRSRPQDSQSYFPPAPPPHPALLPQNLPPGSRIHNADSFNTTYERMQNARNDYSENYGSRAYDRQQGRRNPNVGPSSDPRRNNGDSQYIRQEPPMSPTYSSSRPTNYHNPSNQPYTNFGSQGPNAPIHLSDRSVRNGNKGRTTTLTQATFHPGDISGLGPHLGESFNKLFQDLNHSMTQEFEEDFGRPTEAAPPRRPSMDDMDDGDDIYDHSGSEGEEGDDRMEGTVTNGMAGLSLNEELRPALSLNKSDPQLPQATEFNAPNPASPGMAPRRSESTQDIPERLKEPFVVNPEPSYAPPPYEHPLPPSLAQAFHVNPSSITSQSRPVFNVYNGDHTSIDNSVHTTNTNSFNTDNTLVLDSYNDNSTNVNNAAAAEQRKSKKSFFRRHFRH